jgi:hypothetical protein
MRKLNETELYSLHLSNSQKTEVQNALNMKLNQGVGIITPDHLLTEITDLKVKQRNVHYPLLGEALSLFEQFNGRIRLFNLGVTSSGRSPIPPFMPFLFGAVRNKQLEGESESRPVSPAALMNMNRIGRWSADESQYLGVNARTDLYSVLESALISYRLVVDNKADAVFSNRTVLEYLTNIYTTLFSGAVIKSAINYGSEFNTDAARYIIAQFFLRYVLKKQPSSTIDEFAYKSIKNRTSLAALKNFEEASDINYDKLSTFLETLGQAFFNEKIDISKFEVSWLSMYGEGLVFAIEYIPYLIHFLFAAMHGASLGGSTKLYIRMPELMKDGIQKLYNAIISEIR